MIRFSFLIPLLFYSFFIQGQTISLFQDYTFDSTCRIVALSGSFSDFNKDSKEYAFYVNNADEMINIKNQWKVKKIRPQISLEEYSITIFIIKGKQLVSDEWLIYPKQQIVHYKDKWYDFDMKKFESIQKSYPLNYHSQKFVFDTYMDYVFFKDSIRDVLGYMFLFEPTANKFEGYFNVVSKKTGDPNSTTFTLGDINKEISDKYSPEKFNASHVMNDSFNLDNKDKVRIKIECFKSLYDKYNNKYREKGEWVPYKIDTKVVFKD